MASTYPITGIQEGFGPAGGTPLRQEIDSWSSNPDNLDLVNLFVLALTYFESIPVEKKLSFSKSQVE